MSLIEKNNALNCQVSPAIAANKLRDLTQANLAKLEQFGDLHIAGVQIFDGHGGISQFL